MYLLKYLAHCGVCSRRKAADLITEGLVTVNGVVETMPFTEVSDKDTVLFEGKEVRPEKHVYILLNKPKGFLTTCSDELGRRTVLDLIEDGIDKRIYPVGRLDRMSTGLLLLTNDGDLAQKLSHPSRNIPKEYRVFLNEPLDRKDFNELLDGFELEDGFIKPDECQYGDTRDKREVILQIHSGRNRIIRRMFDFLGYEVEKLDRIFYAGLKKGDVPRGRWRYLTANEVKVLKKSVK